MTNFIFFFFHINCTWAKWFQISLSQWFCILLSFSISKYSTHIDSKPTEYWNMWQNQHAVEIYMKWFHYCDEHSYIHGYAQKIYIEILPSIWSWDLIINFIASNERIVVGFVVTCENTLDFRNVSILL